MKNNPICQRHLLLGLVVFALISHAARAAGPDRWPQFRGGCGGNVDGAKLPSVWSATTNVVWKTAIPGKSWSSPVVCGDKVFVTSAVSGQAVEPPTPAGRPTRPRPRCAKPWPW